MLRESDGGEQAVAERSSRAESTETFPTVVHAHDPTHHPHHVPLMWARRRPPLHVSPPFGPGPPPPTLPAHPHQPVGLLHPLQRPPPSLVNTHPRGWDLVGLCVFYCWGPISLSLSLSFFCNLGKMEGKGKNVCKVIEKGLSCKVRCLINFFHLN